MGRRGGGAVGQWGGGAAGWQFGGPCWWYPSLTVEAERLESRPDLLLVEGAVPVLEIGSFAVGPKEGSALEVVFGARGGLWWRWCSTCTDRVGRLKKLGESQLAEFRIVGVHERSNHLAVLGDHLEWRRRRRRRRRRHVEEGLSSVRGRAGTWACVGGYQNARCVTRSGGDSYAASRLFRGARRGGAGRRGRGADLGPELVELGFP